MAKPKAPRWLTEAFAQGVYERSARSCQPAYGEARNRVCWLAAYDPAGRPCSGRPEVFHFIPRQRVENAMWEALRDAFVSVPEEEGAGWRGPLADPWDLILLAAWDPRNGGIGCEHHHRRLDGHATPALSIAWDWLPDHVDEFALDWGLTDQLERRFPQLT